MWYLQKIQATNICAFEEFEYKLTQGRTTLVFGNNMDDDSQNSNGSGKSALIEAIAIALTGETLRKVNMDEIINDAHDTASVTAWLENDYEPMVMKVERTFSRKKGQEIVITTDSPVYGEEKIVKATVNDYNKYVLDMLGVSKDDVFSNYILTARKYHSFLSSSDRDKKEIINRFSNGVIVDESIDALHEDMEPIQKSQLEAEKKVSECNGRVSALAGEIERAIEESASRSANKKTRIDSWNQSIANKRAEIREANEQINKANERLDVLDGLDEKLQKIEKKEKDTQSAYETIKRLCKESGVQFDYDYASEYNRLQSQLAKSNEQLEDCKKSKKDAESKMKSASRLLEKLKSTYENDLKSVSDKEAAIKEKIDALTNKVLGLKKTYNELNEQRTSIVNKIASLEKQLAGVIQCPKCKHEFTLANDIDVQETRQKLSDERGKEREIEDKITENQKSYNACVSDGRNAREQETEISKERTEIESAYNQAKSDVNKAESVLSGIQHEYEKIESNISSIQRNIDAQKKQMFDEVFDTIDDLYKKAEADIKGLELSISNCEGAIKSYQESIKEIENASETDVISSLKESKEKYEQQLKEAMDSLNDINNKLNELKVQEATFIEFKTYLANTKINAISQITNDFLATIGSDIRVSLSGFTMLKSGKVRDKISVSLLRDGVDCGSFEKFSKGEQTRVELASILALHKLTNVNCEEGKGLNLLIFDEILDATDEQGLTNVFNALNETHITSLVVSHGNIAENYPNRLVVNKRNGISFI